MSTFFSSFFSQDQKVSNLDYETFHQHIKNNQDSVLIDVRTPSEHEQKRIPNSILIDLMKPQFKGEIEKLDKTKSYYIYCRSGNRSYYAAKEMLKMGFEKIHHLAPGILGWYGPTEAS